MAKNGNENTKAQKHKNIHKLTFVRLCIYAFVYSLVYLFFHFFINSFVYFLIDLFLSLFICSLIYLFIHLFIS